MVGCSCKFLGIGNNLLAEQERAQAALEMVQPAHKPHGKDMDKEFSPLKELRNGHIDTGPIGFLLLFPFLALLL